MLVVDMFQVKERGENLSRSEMKLFNESGSCGHRIKMSSINRSHNRGLRLWVWRNSISSFPMKRLAYDGAIRVPMAVPLV